MKKKTLLTMVLSLTLAITSVIPAFAGKWVEENNNWKYYSDNGVLTTGWIESSGSWYYLDASGTMKNGWIKDNGSWYFLYDSGVMAADVWIDNYYVNPSGKWTKTR